MTIGPAKGPERPHDDLASLRAVLSRPSIEALAKDAIERLVRHGTADWNAPPDETEVLCRALVARYPYTANQFIDGLLKAGVPVERIYYGYLSAAARELGERWNKSKVTFQDVGIATTRLYMILDDLRRRMPPPAVPDKPRVAFAAVPGEAHGLGLSMAVDTFRRHGWDVAHLIDVGHDQIVEACENADIVLIGLSASGRRRHAALLKLIAALRIARPDLRIVLSGEITKNDPDLISRVGVDGVVQDVPSALELVQKLLERPSGVNGPSA